MIYSNFLYYSFFDFITDLFVILPSNTIASSTNISSAISIVLDFPNSIFLPVK